MSGPGIAFLTTQSAAFLEPAGLALPGGLGRNQDRNRDIARVFKKTVGLYRGLASRSSRISRTSLANSALITGLWIMALMPSVDSFSSDRMEL